MTQTVALNQNGGLEHEITSINDLPFHISSPSWGANGLLTIQGVSNNTIAHSPQPGDTWNLKRRALKCKSFAVHLHDENREDFLCPKTWRCVGVVGSRWWNGSRQPLQGVKPKRCICIDGNPGNGATRMRQLAEKTSHRIYHSGTAHPTGTDKARRKKGPWIASIIWRLRNSHAQPGAANRIQPRLICTCLITRENDHTATSL